MSHLEHWRDYVDCYNLLPGYKGYHCNQSPNHLTLQTTNDIVSDIVVKQMHNAVMPAVNVLRTKARRHYYNAN